MMTELDPRDMDRHHSNAVHRPDLPTQTNDLQVDDLWSYAGQPGGWYIGTPAVTVPEPATWVLLAIGLVAIYVLRRFA